jgi:hypothetical protein
VIDLASIDGFLDKAFDLACFVQRDREAAVRIVAGALGKLEVATAAQGKRLYYRPEGRPWSRSQSGRLRNKVSFNDLHLLQRLIYIESEPYEIAQEQAKGPSTIGEEDLVIHFIKHLVRRTTKRNSFYVTLGLSRLLHRYTTAETMDIYNAVIQDPERVKDDFYYRSRKGVLMQELKERFGDLINVCHGPRGEERFEADDNPSRFSVLVRECLSFFTPWNTPCLVPVGVDPLREGIPSLSDRGHNEDEIEVNRIHAVLHPDCFGRLISDLRFDSPEARLDIPKFFYASDMNNNGSNSRHAAKLNDEELNSIKRALDNNAARRQVAHARVLRVVIDGNERARFDLSESRSTRFHLDQDAELIEIRSPDNAGREVLLASHVLAHTENNEVAQAADTSITLEGGQKISIAVSSAAGGTDATVNVSYRETNPFRAAALLFHQMAHSVGRDSPRNFWSDRKILVPALAVLLIAIGLIALIKYARKGNAPAPDQIQVAVSQTGGVRKEGTPATGSTAPTSNKTANEEESSRQHRESVQPSPKAESSARNSGQQKPDTSTVPEVATESGIETRSTKARREAVPLSAVKKIYIEILGDDMSKDSVRKGLSERLSSGNRILAVNNRHDADALLEVSVKKSDGAEPDIINVVVELINVRGQVLWPNTSSSGNYQGPVYEVTAKIVRDLLAALQRSNN